MTIIKKIFSDGHLNRRKTLSKLLLTKLNLFNYKPNEISEIPAINIFEANGNLRSEIHEALKESNNWIGTNIPEFEGSFHLTLLLLLIYSYKFYPDDTAWLVFLNTENSEQEAIIGVKEIWLNLQSSFIENVINGHFKGT